jgi:NTE family protein
MTVAFVLAGGGSLAASQVGMLRALNESGIEPDIVVGASAGGINAFCFGQHPTHAGIERLRRLWCGLRRRDVFPLNPWQIVTGLAGRGDGLVPPRRLRAFLHRHTGGSELGETTIPVHIVTTDLADGQPVVLSHGPAVSALMATTALPGIFPPVLVGQRHLIDGGVAADVPIRQAEDLGATVTYVLPSVGPAPASQVPRGALPVLLHAVGHLFGHAVATDLAAARGEVHVLPAPSQGDANPFDFRSTSRLIEEGYAAAKAALTAPHPRGAGTTLLAGAGADIPFLAS